MTERGPAKILDFGLAKTAHAAGSAGQIASSNRVTRTIDEQHLTSPGSAVGTVCYMSPEQARAKDLDARSDLFSFGAVLYEMVTGQLPFRGDSTATIFESILNRAPIAAVRLNPDVPPKLEDIINKALEKDRDLRYQSAAEMRSDLKRLRRDTDSEHSSSTSAASISKPAMTQRQLTANAGGHGVNGAAISPDGKYLVYSDDTGLHIKSAETGEMRTLPLPDELSSPHATWRPAAWFPDSTRVLTILEVAAKPPSIWILSLIGDHRASSAMMDSPIRFRRTEEQLLLPLHGPD